MEHRGRRFDTRSARPSSKDARPSGARSAVRAGAVFDQPVLDAAGVVDVAARQPRPRRPRGASRQTQHVEFSPHSRQLSLVGRVNWQGLQQRAAGPWAPGPRRRAAPPVRSSAACNRNSEAARAARMASDDPGCRLRPFVVPLLATSVPFLCIIICAAAPAASRIKLPWLPWPRRMTRGCGRGRGSADAPAPMAASAPACGGVRSAEVLPNARAAVVIGPGINQGIVMAARRRPGPSSRARNVVERPLHWESACPKLRDSAISAEPCRCPSATTERVQPVIRPEPPEERPDRKKPARAALRKATTRRSASQSA